MKAVMGAFAGGAIDRRYPVRLSAAFTFSPTTAGVLLAAVRTVDSMASITIDDSDWAERARLTCPRGHNWWEASASSWYCRTCGRSYDEFLDTKTGTMVAREQVLLKDGFRHQ